jgi:hypothetical protein
VSICLALDGGYLWIKYSRDFKEAASNNLKKSFPLIEHSYGSFCKVWLLRNYSHFAQISNA